MRITSTYLASEGAETIALVEQGPAAVVAPVLACLPLPRLRPCVQEQHILIVDEVRLYIIHVQQPLHVLHLHDIVPRRFTDLHTRPHKTY